MLVIAKVFKNFSFLCAIRGHFTFVQILYGSPMIVSCGYNKHSFYIKLANIKSEVSNERIFTGYTWNGCSYKTTSKKDDVLIISPHDRLPLPPPSFSPSLLLPSPSVKELAHVAQNLPFLGLVSKKGMVSKGSCCYTLMMDAIFYLKCYYI